jgi:hypothetical protein
MQDNAPTRRKLTIRALCERYGNITPRTVSRWLAVGILPQPLFIANRRYWDEEEIEAAERNMVRQAKKSGTFSRKLAEDATTA